MIAAFLRGACGANRKRCVTTAQNPAYRLIRHFYFIFCVLWCLKIAPRSLLPFLSPYILRVGSYGFGASAVRCEYYTVIIDKSGIAAVSFLVAISRSAPASRTVVLSRLWESWVGKSPREFLMPGLLSALQAFRTHADPKTPGWHPLTQRQNRKYAILLPEPS
jgi:hypothetical protein